MDDIERGCGADVDRRRLLLLRSEKGVNDRVRVVVSSWSTSHCCRIAPLFGCCPLASMTNALHAAVGLVVLLLRFLNDQLQGDVVAAAVAAAAAN